MTDPCPFCGGQHPPGLVGQPGTWLEGVEFKTCPEIPRDHVYEDREYEKGPRGALHKIDPASDDQHGAGQGGMR